MKKPFLVATLLFFSACEDKPPTRPNVVLVALDDVRWDHTTLSGYERRTTPSLEELAGLPGTVTFESAWSAASWSLPSYASVFTGRYPVHHGAGLRSEKLAPSETTMAEMLMAHGYRCVGFGGGPHVSGALGFDQGFDEYQAPLRLSPLNIQVGTALAWVKHHLKEGEGEPFFLFVHGYDAHVPYYASPLIQCMFDPDYVDGVHDIPGLNTPEGFFKLAGGVFWPMHHPPNRPALPDAGPDPTGSYVWHDKRYEPYIELTEADLHHLVAHYDAAIRQADIALARLLIGLEDLGVLDESIVVVFADHGEALGENGYFRHESESGDSVFHVPLVIRMPGLRTPPSRWKGVVSLVDLLPTIADRLGFKQPPLLDGESLLYAWKGGAIEDRAVAGVSTNAWMVRSMNWRLLGMLRMDGPPVWTLHADGEGPDVSEQNPDVVDTLLKEVADWPERPNDSGRVPMITSPALQQAIQKGGYWTPQAVPSPEVLPGGRK